MLIDNINPMPPSKEQHLNDFWRVATKLRCMKIDLHYAETRKLIDPKWDGYIRDKHDIEDEDADPINANLVTSLHRDSDRHSAVLDLDNGAYSSVPLMGRGHIRLNQKSPIWFQRDKDLINTLEFCGITNNCPKPMIHRTSDGNGFIDIFTEHDYVLMESSTKGHNHLIIDADMSWAQYQRLLNIFSTTGIIEPGYEKASLHRGFSAIRMPWVKKDLEMFHGTP